MNISPINFSGFSKNPVLNKKQKNNQDLSAVKKEEYKPLITANQYLSFTGGKSLDLSLTKKQIEKFGEFPPDIKENIEAAIKDGNSENKTLIDIHKEKYEGLSQINSLSEVKFYYPEFKDVLPDYKVDYKKNSFIDDAKNGLIKGIDSDVDLSLQLLQLYWGEGFSLNDLKEQFGGRNIDGVLNKLNIPKVDKLYGQYLKLSDKEYNERFASMMSERLHNSSRERMIKKEGVYIPKGPLSDEHKKHISEGLKKYYSENPDKIYKMSERQIKYYEDNPQEKEILSEVLKRAWSYRDASSIKKAMSKFAKKEHIEGDVEEIILSPNNKTMQKFWNRNVWAKAQFSKCMQKSWVRQKELMEMGLIKEPVCTIKMMPSKFIQKFIAAKKNEIPDIENFLYIQIGKNDKTGRYSMHNKYDETVINKWDCISLKDDEDIGDAMVSSIAKSLCDMQNEIKKGKGDKYKHFEELKSIWHDSMYLDKKTSQGRKYWNFISYCIGKGYIEEVKLIDNNLDFCYDKARLNLEQYSRFYTPLIQQLYPSD